MFTSLTIEIFSDIFEKPFEIIILLVFSFIPSSLAHLLGKRHFVDLLRYISFSGITRPPSTILPLTVRLFFVSHFFCLPFDFSRQSVSSVARFRFSSTTMSIARSFLIPTSHFLVLCRL